MRTFTLPIGDATEFLGAPVKEEVTGLSRTQVSTTDRAGQFAIAAANAAIADASLQLSQEDRSRVGVAVGTSLGGIATQEAAYKAILVDNRQRLGPFTLVKIMYNSAAAQICLQHDLSGPSLTYSTTCSSSSVAIGEAARQIRHGYVDVMLAGGTEAPFGPVAMKAWEALHILATPDQTDLAATCKPFSRNRSGTVLGEGSAFVLLEELTHAEERGARIYAELAGYGQATDAHHLTQPSVACQIRTMRLALDDAQLDPSEVDYINAHGTGTALNDASETEAVRAILPEPYRIPVSSTKSMHGHLVGAAGAVELLITVLALKHQVVPPTAHLNLSDPVCDLDYVPLLGRTHPIRAALSNSFGVGGTAATLVVVAPG